MASAPTIFFLSCWLAGHSGAQGQRLFPKPLVGVSPSWVVAPGENVSIRCEGRFSDVEFLLRKARYPNLQQRVVPAGTVAEFPLPSVGRADAGSYSCEYRPTTDPTRWSHPSDPLELVVADPSLPRPSASLSPTGVTVPGADVTIRCQGPGGDVRFFLHQAGDLTRPRPMDPAGDGAEFHIRPVGRQHEGSYSCSYRPRAEPFVSSAPSDPVGLVVAGETDLTQPGAAPDPTRAGPEASPEHPDFTHGNIARLGLGAGVLLALGLILAEAYCSRPRGEP